MVIKKKNLLLGLTRVELSSSEATEQAGSRHPGKRLITFLPPCCFPSHLGMEKGTGEFAAFPAFLLLPREDEGDEVVNCVSAGAVTAQASVCPLQLEIREGRG